MLTELDSVFDGYMHRRFSQSIDGWMNEQPNVADYPSVQNAKDTLALFNELCKARKEIWDLKKKLSYYKPVTDNAVS